MFTLDLSVIFFAMTKLSYSMCSALL